MAAVASGARFAIKTLTLAPLSPNVTCLCDKIFANGSVAELKIVGSNLEKVDEHAFDASPPVRLQGRHSALLRHFVARPSGVHHISLQGQFDVLSYGIRIKSKRDGHEISQHH